MLKITSKELDGGRRVELKMEGMISGDWAKELKLICERFLAGSVEQLILDFSSVTSIGREGQELLKKVDCPKIKIVGCNLFLRDRIRGLKLKKCEMETGKDAE
jgi:anti-anti-sigma regulatory factor